MSKNEGDTRAKLSIKSNIYFCLTLIFLAVGAGGFILGLPLLFGAAMLVALFLIVGGFYSLANERGWMD